MTGDPSPSLDGPTRVGLPSEAMQGPGTRGVWTERGAIVGGGRPRDHARPVRSHPHRHHGHCGFHPLLWVAAILLITGAAVAAAVVAAVLVGLWLLSTVVTRPVRATRTRPRRADDPWRALDERAGQAQKRYRACVRSAAAGPLQERLAELHERVDASAKDARRMARRGRELESLVRNGTGDGEGATKLVRELRERLARRVEGLEAAAGVAVELTLRAELDLSDGDAGEVAGQLTAIIAALDAVEDADRV